MRLERYGGLLFSWTPTRVRDSSGLRFEVGNIGTKTGATDESNRPQKGDPKVPFEGTEPSVRLERGTDPDHGDRSEPVPAPALPTRRITDDREQGQAVAHDGLTGEDRDPLRRGRLQLSFERLQVLFVTCQLCLGKAQI